MPPEEKKGPIVEENTGTGVTNTPPVTSPPTEPEEDDTEILALKDEVQKKIDEKSGEKESYSKQEVADMFKKFEKKFAQRQESADEEFIDILNPDEKMGKFVRIARLNDKFVVGLKDMNKDSYSDEPVYVTNIEHPTKKGEFVPWATFIYDDGSEELYPYLSFMNRAVGVWGEVIDEKKTDVSETFGTVDVKSVDAENEWDLKKTGKKVLAKALKYRTLYVCKDIKKGTTLTVSEDVINKVEAPYSELKKFLEQK
jgi:hypothetical protein